MASLARLCVHRLHWQSPPQGGLLRRHSGSNSSLSWRPTSSRPGCYIGSSSPPLLQLRGSSRGGARRCSCCSASASGGDDSVTPDAPLLLEAGDGSVRSARWKPQAVWAAVGVIGILALGVAVAVVFRRKYLMGSAHQREASQLISGLSSSPSSLQAADQLTVNWFGREFSLRANSPGYMYFLLLVVAGFGLPASEEALNVWVGGTLGRMLIWDQSRDAFLSSVSANLPYIASTIIWVYWGVCIGDLVPFFAGRQAAKSGTGNLIREKLGVSKEKFDRIKGNVRRFGNLIGIVERFSLGVRVPTSFLAGYVGINPPNYLAGLCVGALITLPLQMGVGLVLRDRPMAALAGVAAVVGVWTMVPYIAAGVGSAMYIAHRKRRKQSTKSVEGTNIT